VSDGPATAHTRLPPAYLCLPPTPPPALPVPPHRARVPTHPAHLPTTAATTTTASTIPYLGRPPLLPRIPHCHHYWTCPASGREEDLRHPAMWDTPPHTTPCLPHSHYSCLCRLDTLLHVLPTPAVHTHTRACTHCLTRTHTPHHYHTPSHTAHTAPPPAAFPSSLPTLLGSPTPTLPAWFWPHAACCWVLLHRAHLLQLNTLLPPCAAPAFVLYETPLPLPTQTPTATHHTAHLSPPHTYPPHLPLPLLQPTPTTFPAPPTSWCCLFCLRSFLPHLPTAPHIPIPSLFLPWTLFCPHHPPASPCLP